MKYLIILTSGLLAFNDTKAQETIDQIVERHVQKILLTRDVVASPRLIKKTTYPDGRIEEIYFNEQLNARIGLREEPAKVEPIDVLVNSRRYTIKDMSNEEAFESVVQFEEQPIFMQQESVVAAPVWYQTGIAKRPGLLARLRENRLTRIVARTNQYVAPTQYIPTTQYIQPIRYRVGSTCSGPNCPN